MLIVGTDAAAVETALVGGRLACPNCGSVLRPWAHGTAREVRCRTGSQHRRPRRSICAGCRRTHVLLAEDTLVRRRDAVDVIGDALTAWVGGSGHRAIAWVLGVPADTVRGWIRRFRLVAVRIRELFTRWAHVLDPGRGPVVPTGSAAGDALDAIGVVGVLAVRRFGPRSPWALASTVTNGTLLANTSSPWSVPM